MIYIFTICRNCPLQRGREIPKFLGRKPRHSVSAENIGATGEVGGRGSWRSQQSPHQNSARGFVGLSVLWHCCRDGPQGSLTPEVHWREVVFVNTKDSPVDKFSGVLSEVVMVPSPNGLWRGPRRRKAVGPATQPQSVRVEGKGSKGGNEGRSVKRGSRSEISVCVRSSGERVSLFLSKGFDV